MFTIRPFEPTDADYQAMEAIDRAMFPEYPRSANEWRYFDQTRNPRYFYHRDMIEFNGDVIGFGSYSQMSWSFHPQKYLFQITAYPDHQHLNVVRDQYFDHIMVVLEEFNPVAITSGMLQDRSDHVGFLIEHGFEEIMRAPISLLEIAAFDPASYAELLDRVCASGI